MPSPTLISDRNCWRIETADRAAVIIDAEDYFRAARRAMMNARKRIMLVGWDFDARVHLYDHAQDDDGPLAVGAYLHWLVQRRPELQIHVLRWDMGALTSLFRGTTLLDAFRWWRHPRLHWKLDGNHPVGAAQHQKILTIDGEMAFCGGIDITNGRWDSRQHADEAPGRLQPDNTDAGPWHDITTALEGLAARALDDFCRMRWEKAGGKALAPVTSGMSCWPMGLDAPFKKVAVAIARTQARMPDQAGIFEIEALYVDLIAKAQHFIYAESQYFTSYKIAKAIVRRLSEPDGPEIAVVTPETSEGWLESKVMDTARARLVSILRRYDKYRRFRLFHALSEGGHPIYIHAKIMIVDDRILRVGSSNMNNRSLGLDTECDLVLDADHAKTPAATARIRKAIVHIRNDLLAEHLGCDVEQVEATLKDCGSLIGTIETIRSEGRTLRDYRLPDLNMAENWLSEREILDPRRPQDLFEAPRKRRLFRFRR
ncbi:phospholipase D/transphosphatidylase [Iodidimonas gelatinilytica]|uniref:Phospholipase D n=1 Tax=Iodidimonas gelatinilytica TaxID=1236966 RepID=A0A5A7MSF2_9PROT|nr:phospholipase D-like domain-containing protein [Iodidimonas gelatinilytica]GEQ98871.1 phospholipase D/transphosphatidylase [Iodidimonas gelatinilytica]